MRRLCANFTMTDYQAFELQTPVERFFQRGLHSLRERKK
ncbi:hypothetical protein M081_4321 [Bacteroides fragilis str. 3998 T(B) 4]|nr:hypothetical protein M081_4321 [Bacteroides fragilis str. 3998 T(B) 4]